MIYSAVHTVLSTPELLSMVLSECHDPRMKLKELNFNCLLVNRAFFREAARIQWSTASSLDLARVECPKRRQMYANFVVLLFFCMPVGKLDGKLSDYSQDYFYVSAQKCLNLKYNRLTRLDIVRRLMRADEIEPNHVTKHYINFKRLPFFNSQLKKLEAFGITISPQELKYVLLACPNLACMNLDYPTETQTEIITKMVRELPLESLMFISRRQNSYSVDSRLVIAASRNKHLSSLSGIGRWEQFKSAIDMDKNAFKKLKYLDLYWPSINPESELRPLANLANLSELVLHITPETVDSDKICSKLVNYFPNLQVLTCFYYDCRINHGDFMALSKLAGLRHLRFYSEDRLSNDLQFRDQDVAILTKAWPLLETFYMRHDSWKVSALALMFLASCRHLAHLKMAGIGSRIDVAALIKYQGQVLFPAMTNFATKLFSSDPDLCLNEFYEYHIPKFGLTERSQCKGVCCS